MRRQKQSLTERQKELKARMNGTQNATMRFWDGLPPITVQEAARRLCSSEDWVRLYFRQFIGEGVLVLPKIQKNNRKRNYVRMRIPEWLFAREWKKLAGTANEGSWLNKNQPHTFVTS